MVKEISVIVPTFREGENLPHLIRRLEEVKDNHSLDMEVLIMDDDSDDGSPQVVRSLNKPWVRFLTRKSNRGLSPAVLDGIQAAKYDQFVVMDADLSHPPEAIPKMLCALDEGYDFAMGSRYVRGATTAENWGLFRWLNSKVATLMAKPLVSVKDPMSGFFAMRKTSVAAAPFLNPVGYKIALELLVKCRCTRVAEVPIHFANREHGKSKLTFKQQLQYLKHLRRLYLFKFAERSYLTQFMLVGLSGVVVNMTILTLLLALNIPSAIAVAAAIGVSMVTNFFLNRRFTFSYAKAAPILKQFLGFVAACSVGTVVNYGITMSLIRTSSIASKVPQIAALIGILVGTVFNYVINRCCVFRKRA